METVDDFHAIQSACEAVHTVISECRIVTMHDKKKKITNYFTKLKSQARLLSSFFNVFFKIVNLFYYWKSKKTLSALE